MGNWTPELIASRFATKRVARDLSPAEQVALDGLRDGLIAQAQAIVTWLPDTRQSTEAVRFLENALDRVIAALQNGPLRAPADAPPA